MAKRALVSVSDKTGIVEFCQGLAGLGFEIISTGGTLKALAAASVPAHPVSEVTGVPEIMGGRVKTLHPAVFGAILVRQNMIGDLETLAELGMEPIQVVAVNLKPFAVAVNSHQPSDEQIMDQIDIGGPALLRAAAKNYRDVYGVVDPADYEGVLGAISSGRDADFMALRRRLATKVFEYTARYDSLVHQWMGRTDPAPPDTMRCGA